MEGGWRGDGGGMEGGWRGDGGGMEGGWRGEKMSLVQFLAKNFFLFEKRVAGFFCWGGEKDHARLLMPTLNKSHLVMSIAIEGPDLKEVKFWTSSKIRTIA